MYVPFNPEQSGQLVYIGLHGTSIHFDDESLSWIATRQKDPTVTTAITRAPKESLLLGTYDWKVFNDSRECHESYPALLTLSGCGEDQFREVTAKIF